MLAFHESGHVLAAWLTGGSVQRVVLVPWAFSRTDVEPNPQPRIVAWSGPMLGGLMPLLALVAGSKGFPPVRRFLKFFAGFCLIANGAYLASAMVMPVGDTDDLLRLGTPGWIMTLAGGVMLGAGLWLWHTLGKPRPRAEVVRPPT
jgi:hypothetical protein